jgi:hypothetical protein
MGGDRDDPVGDGVNVEAAYELLADGGFLAGPLTVGPWDPRRQHGGPPSALIARAVERAAAPLGFAHLGRLTVNLLRPAPLGECRIVVGADYVGRGAAHFSGALLAEGKEIARFTALAQREQDVATPAGTPGHPPPAAPATVEESAPMSMALLGEGFGYARLVENRRAVGTPFRGPSAVWFRLRHPLVGGEPPSPYGRVVVAADSSNGVSASLDFAKYLFVNCDLTINLFRRPVGEWICLDARSVFAGNGCGLAESALYDVEGLIGRATQSLAVRAR